MPRCASRKLRKEQGNNSAACVKYDDAVGGGATPMTCHGPGIAALSRLTALPLV